MTKRQLQIALLALGWPRLATASISVPQASAADYIFSSPVLTNNIRGVLVDPESSYRVIRSEDVDWLLEAFSERNSILSGNVGLWRGAGPAVRNYDTMFDIGGTGWLDADAPILGGVRLIVPRPTLTNTYARTTYTNVWTNAVSVITMPMTNGTVSAHTNSWSMEKRRPVPSVSTNVHVWTDVDYCHGLDGIPFPAYSNVSASAWGYYGYNTFRFPTVKSIAYAREILRGTKRLADYGLHWTNEALTVSENSYNYPTTNVGAACSYEFNANYWYSESSCTESFTADVPTRFTSLLVTTGGANRVSVEAAFARCYFSYYNSRGTVISTNAVVRLGVAELATSGPIACCRVSLNARNLCSACASAARAPSPPSSLGYNTPEGSYEFWQFYVENIVLFYSIEPTVRLPDW